MKMKPNGIWVSPNEFVSFAEMKSSKEPFATRSIVTHSAFGVNGILPNPDPILKKMGTSIQVYRDLMADAHIGGIVRRRKAAVLSLEYGFDREHAKSNIAEFIEHCFSKLNLRQIISEALDAALFGYVPLEVMWDEIDGYIVPTAVVGKPSEWFFFDDENQLKMKTKETTTGVELPARKFLLVRQDATYDNPYGIADLSRCFWPTQFKRGGLEFWLKFTEKYGSPFLVGKHPRNTHHQEVDALLTSLEAMVQDAVAAIPDDSSIEILEAAGKSSSADVYERFLMFCRSEVSIALTGTNQGTEADTTNASAQTGLEVANYIRDGDAALVAEAINQLVRWIVEINFDENEAVPVWDMWSAETIDKTQAERDQILKASGANFTNQYFQREYNLQDGDLGEQLPATSMDTGYSAFAERGQSKSKNIEVNQAVDQLADETQPIIENWLSRIKQLAEQSGSLAELQERLLDEFDKLPEEQLVKLMSNAFIAANLQGRDIVK